MLFMGEEWAASTPWQFFTSHPEPELGRATAEGRIEEFAKMGWDPLHRSRPAGPRDLPSLQAAVGRGRRTGCTRGCWRPIGSSIALRRGEPDLNDPAFASLSADVDDEQRWIRLGHGRIDIAVNLADEARLVPVRAGARVLWATDAAGSGIAVGEPVAEPTISLAGRSAAVLRVA